MPRHVPARALLSVLLATALLAGCGGGGSSQPTPLTAGGATGTLQITISIPGTSTMVRGVRHPLYTSRDSKGIGVEFQTTGGTAYSGAPSASPNFASALSASVNGCTVPLASGAYTCVVVLGGVPVGYDDLRVTLWNATPNGCASGSSGSGCVFTTATDRALSSQVITNQLVLSGTNNALNFTLLPIVDSVDVKTNTPIVDGAALSPSSPNVFLTLKDAAGDIILGTDQLIDKSGNNLTVTLDIANDLGAGGCNRWNAATPCSLYFTTASQPSFTTAGASGNQLTVNYDGAGVFPTSGSLPQVTIGGVSSIGGSNYPATFIVTKSTTGPINVPAAPQYASVSGAYGSAPSFVVSGSDSNIYAVAGSTIEFFTPCSSVLPAHATCALTNVSTVSGTPVGLAAGSDLDLWYTNAAGNVVKQPVGASGTASATAVGGHTLGAITAGPDGNMWFLDLTASNLDSIAPNGMAITTHGIGSVPYAGVLAAGTFANGQQAVCTSAPNGGFFYVDCLAIGGAFSTPTVAAQANAMAFGPDGLLYVTLANGTIQSFYYNAGAALLSQTYTLANAGTGAQAQGIVATPDGSMWFTETGNTNVIGRIAIQSTGSPNPATKGLLTEYGSGVQLPAATTPGAIVVGSDNKLWFADTGATNKTVDQVLP